jgi:hypothetical protein
MERLAKFLKRFKYLSKHQQKNSNPANFRQVIINTGYNFKAYFKGDTTMSLENIEHNISISISKSSKNKKKAFVFVLMPFHPDFNDEYELGIKATCESVGAICQRVDEQIYTEDMISRIYQQIEDADVVISELTGKNPNVFYETGYAHAFAKQVILVTKEKSDIPFDLAHYPHIIYEGKITTLKSELEKKLKWCIDHPTPSQNTPLRWDDYEKLIVQRESLSFYSHYIENTIERDQCLTLYVEPNSEISFEECLKLISSPMLFFRIILSENDDSTCLVLGADGIEVGKVINPIIPHERKYFYTELNFFFNCIEFKDTYSTNATFKISNVKFKGITENSSKIMLQLPVKDYHPRG